MKSRILYQFYLILLLVFMISCNNEKEKPGLTDLSGIYLGISGMEDKPEILAPNTISTSNFESTPVFTNDGKELYYTFGDITQSYMAIVYMKEVDGKWTKPETCSFSGYTTFQDKNPFITADGKRLYFASNRPVNDSSEVKDDFDIWYVERCDTGWNNLTRLDTIINTNKNEDCPTLTNSGVLYFTANYDKGLGSYDIYRSNFINGKFEIPVILDSTINSKYNDNYPFISPNGEILIFSSNRFEQGEKGQKLYVSLYNDEGWESAEIIDTSIQSNNWDYAPKLSFDKRYLFFSSYRTEWDKPFNSRKPNFQEIMSLTTEPSNGSSDAYWIEIKNVEGWDSFIRQ